MANMTWAPGARDGWAVGTITLCGRCNRAIQVRLWEGTGYRYCAWAHTNGSTRHDAVPANASARSLLLAHRGRHTVTSSRAYHQRLRNACVCGSYCYISCEACEQWQRDGTNVIDPCLRNRPTHEEAYRQAMDNREPLPYAPKNTRPSPRMMLTCSCQPHGCAPHCDTCTAWEIGGGHGCVAAWQREQARLKLETQAEQHARTPAPPQPTPAQRTATVAAAINDAVASLQRGYGGQKLAKVTKPDRPGSGDHPPRQVNAKNRLGWAAAGFLAGLGVMWGYLRRHGATPRACALHSGRFRSIVAVYRRSKRPFQRMWRNSDEIMDGR